MALLFPNYELLSAESVSSLDKTECACPKGLKALSCCMRHCLQKINRDSPTKFTRINKAVLIDKELSMENNELTPSFKLIPRNIEKIYKDYIDYLETGAGELPANGYLLEMEG